MTNAHEGAQSDTRRFKLIPPEKLTPEQKAVADAIRSGPRSKVVTSSAAKPGPIGGPFNVWLRTPEIGNIIQQLGAALRFRTSLPTKLNEMAIILTARQWTSQYEWFSHCKLALQAGLDPSIADDIANGRRPSKMDADETIVYNFSTELHRTHGVSDATYQAALDRFGERGVVDLIAVSGYYVLVSMCLNVDKTPLPAGEKLPLPPLP